MKPSISCNHCSKPNAPSHCRVCKIAHYCNKQCQKSDWSVHKDHCTKNERLIDVFDTVLAPLCLDPTVFLRVATKFEEIEYLEKEKTTYFFMEDSLCSLPIPSGVNVLDWYTKDSRSRVHRDRPPMTTEQAWKFILAGQCDVVSILTACFFHEILTVDNPSRYNPESSTTMVYQFRLPKDMTGVGLVYAGKKVVAVSPLACEYDSSHDGRLISCYEKEADRKKKPREKWDCDNHNGNGHKALMITLENGGEAILDPTAIQYYGLELSYTKICKWPFFEVLRVHPSYNDSCIQPMYGDDGWAISEENTNSWKLLKDTSEWTRMVSKKFMAAAGEKLTTLYPDLKYVTTFT